MTRPGLPPSGSAAVEKELLARLGLPTSASSEDVDDLHQAVSEYLAAAPSHLRSWAHAQAAALDEAYLLLTDPVGLEGSALRSPTWPPAVVPGGPATPPARRDPAPAVVPITAAALSGVAATETVEGSDAVELNEDAADADDLEALYASVTPSAHRDTLPDQRAKATPAIAPAAVVVRRSRRRAVAAPVVAQAVPQGPNPWKRIVIAGAAVIVLAGGIFGIYQLGGGGTPAGSGAPIAQATPGAPAIDEAKVADLMAKIAANPKDTATLLALADEYYAGQQFAQAGEWLDKLLAIEPENVQALLARGAVYFNLTELAAAEATWQKVVAIDPKNAEVHYDLGFLYLNQPTPDWAGVSREWNLVIQLDPGSDLAKTVKSHLDSLVASSMMPASSPAASGAPSAAPITTPAPSPIPSAAASTQP